MITYSDNDLLARLPHAEPRPGQLDAIRYILDAFNAGKRFVFLEAPTGSGKSAIGLTVADFYDHSYYLTIQKILQAQISRDYAESMMVELKGRNAYPCTFYRDYGPQLVQLSAGLSRGWKQADLDKQLARDPRCDDGYCHRSLNKFSCRTCFPYDRKRRDGVLDPDPAVLQRLGMRYSTCPYYEQVQRAIDARKVLMNFSSFLYQTGFTDRFGQRDLLVIDEGHHCEEQLMDFVTMTINDRDLAAAGLELPDLEETTDYALWLLDNNVDSILADLVNEARRGGNAKRQEELQHTQQRLQRFLQCIADGMTDWVHELKVHNLGRDNCYRSVTIKPVFVSHFANELLWSYGQKVLIMSATILSAKVMAQALGIDQDDLAFYRMPNSFPVENRPIFIIPAVRATGGKSNQHTWGPPMVKWVDGIVRKYRGQRGIIHTHNFAIANMLRNQCRERDRFLFQESFRDKVDMLAAHARRADSVLVAPAMHEGLDLKDDLSRFQIIAKTPYPNFFDDKQLAARIENDRRFLIWLVALKLVQAYGRSVRSDTDWAHTYIIDGAVNRFLVEANWMLPDWFREAIIHVSLNGES